MLLSLCFVTNSALAQTACYHVLRASSDPRENAYEYFSHRLGGVLSSLRFDERPPLLEVLQSLKEAQSKKHLSAQNRAEYLASVGAVLLFESFLWRSETYDSPKIRMDFLRNILDERFQSHRQQLNSLSPTSVEYRGLLLKLVHESMQDQTKSERELFWRILAVSDSGFNLRRFQKFKEQYKRENGIRDLARRFESQFNLVLTSEMSDIETLNLKILDNEWPAVVLAHEGHFDGVHRPALPYNNFHHDVVGHFLAPSLSLVTKEQRHGFLQSLARLEAPVDKKILNIMLFVVLHERKIDVQEFYRFLVQKQPLSPSTLKSLIWAVEIELTGPYRAENYLSLSEFKLGYQRLIDFFLK